NLLDYCAAENSSDIFLRRASEKRRLRQLALDPERRDPGAGEAEAALVHEVARLPPGEELGVEAVEPLDLEPRIAERDRPAGGAIEESVGLPQEPCERGEVERDVADATVAKEDQRPRDHELRHPVRGVATAAHQRQGLGVQAAGRHELQEAADR